MKIEQNHQRREVDTTYIIPSAPLSLNSCPMSFKNEKHPDKVIVLNDSQTAQIKNTVNS